MRNPNLNLEIGSETKDQNGEVWTVMSTNTRTGSPIVQLWNRQTGQTKYVCVTLNYFA